MSIEFWKIAGSLGVPGFALAVFYALFKQFKFELPRVNQVWAGPIVVIFIASVTFVTYQALSYGFSNEVEKSDSNKVKATDRDLAESLTSSLHELERNLVVLNSLSAVYNGRADQKAPSRVDYSESMRFFTRYFDLVFPVTYGEAENLIPFLSALDDASLEINSIETKPQIDEFNKRSYLSVDDIRLLTGFYVYYLDGLIEKYLPVEFTYTYDPHYKIYSVKGDELVMNVFTLDGEPVRDYGTVLGLLD